MRDKKVNMMPSWSKVVMDCIFYIVENCWVEACLVWMALLTNHPTHHVTLVRSMCDDCTIVNVTYVATDSTAPL